MSHDSADKTDWKRREFLLAGAAALGICGCQTGSSGAGAGSAGTSGGGPSHLVDAGPASNYASDGFYANFRDLGFFLIRHGGQLTAISSYCTHRHCKLDAEKDHSFTCPCHGSEFTPAGKVKEGPATKDLPILVTATDSRGHLMVSVANG